MGDCGTQSWAKKLNTGKVCKPAPEDRPAPDPLQTSRGARRIAYFLVAMMVFPVLGHYVLTLVLGLLGGEKQTIEIISAIFRGWFPINTGFAAGAITYLPALGG